MCSRTILHKKSFSLSGVLGQKQIVVHLLTTSINIPVVANIFRIVYLLSIEAYLAAKILKSRREDSFGRKKIQLSMNDFFPRVKYLAWPKDKKM